MSEKNLENIIIFLLVVVIIYMIYKRNEKMTNNIQPENNYQKTQMNPVKETQMMADQETQMKPIQETQVQPIQKELIVEGVSNEKLRYNVDDKCEQVEQRKFIDEYMNYSRFGNKIDKISTDEEINAYRKSFLDFRNVTNQTSHGFDPVDQMNLDKISGLYQGGLKIHEVYDKIAAKNFDTSKIDLYSMQMNERIDDTIRSNTFEYDNDEVSNGGFFFEKIKGNENTDGLKSFP
jgi:hypothetical protein